MTWINYGYFLHVVIHSSLSQTVVCHLLNFVLSFGKVMVVGETNKTATVTVTAALQADSSICLLLINP